MSRRRKALYLFLGLGVVLALLVASTIAKVRRGEDLLWIAELWAPAAVLSIGVVTGIEFLIGHPKPKVEAEPQVAPGLRGPAAPKEPVGPGTSGQALVTLARPGRAVRPKKAVTKAKLKAPAKKAPKK